jgi:exodeoxyribonuclease VII large subunit
MAEETVWSVSSLALAVKRSLEGQFGEVQVRGELGRVTRHSSGHMYFDLKDADAVLHAAWFRNAQRRNAATLEQGMEVVITGRLSTYPLRSEYQLIVTGVELAGVGALLKLIEERKKKLAAEGLFEENRKKALPFLPRTIGIITSPTGAVIQDILHRLRDRYMPHVLLWPVQVQGETAAEQVRAAVEGFQKVSPKPDVIIVARGGGSVEDLMPFNDESLVRAVAACSIPFISAIGHETDWTLIDFAADVRAPTPTGAAEMAVPVKEGLVAAVQDFRQRIDTAISRFMRHTRTQMEAQGRALVHPRALLENMMQRLDERSLRLAHALKGWLHVRNLQLTRLVLRHPREQLARQSESLRQLSSRLTQDMALRALEKPGQRLALAGKLLDTLSYERVLERGFALALTPDGHAVSRAAKAPADMRLRFADGEIEVRKAQVP